MTTYEEILNELKDNINVKAKDYVPRLAEALKKEDDNRTGSDIVDIIKKDCGYWSKETIRKFVPAELKDEVKRKAGKKGAEETNKQKIAIATTGESLPENNPAESRNYTPEIEKVKTVFKDLNPEDNEPPDPEQIPEAVFTAKRLAKALDEINVLKVLREQDLKTIAQLNEALKKNSFTPATDAKNVYNFEKLSPAMLAMEARKLISQGVHKMNVHIEVLS